MASPARISRLTLALAVAAALAGCATVQPAGPSIAYLDADGQVQVYQPTAAAQMPRKAPVFQPTLCSRCGL